MAEKESMPVGKESTPPPEAMQGSLMNLRTNIDRLFDDFMSWSPFRSNLLHEPLSRVGLMRGTLHPRADLIEQEDCYQIDLDVPGMKKENIQIALTDNTLTVRGQMEASKEEKAKDYYFCERQHGAFSRSFSLPKGVDTEKIAADLHEGVLSINLPKTPEAQTKPRHIEVKAH